MKQEDMLKLDRQLCFPLYAASRKVINKYRPFLKPLGLTYTQYISLMVLWEHHRVSAKDLGQVLHLDSGTLTPLLKGLEKKGLITRHRSDQDERLLIIELTPEGEALKEKAAKVPPQMAACVRLEPEEAAELHRLLYKLMDMPTLE